MTDDPSWMLELVGTPYSEMNCWDLWLYVCERRCMHIPESIFGWRKLLRRVPQGEPMRAYDAVLLREPDLWIVHHIGVGYDAENFLHSAREFGGVVLDRVSRYAVKLRMVARPVNDS